MIDWHSHILPGLDDGSRDVAESISLINMQASQGVRTVVATPHFYANDETVDAFLARREKAFRRLVSELPKGAPEIRLGAEVKYYQGISRMADLKALRIEGSNLLLLEMPVTQWTEYMVRELIELSGKGSMQIVLAHVERYLTLQSQALWNRIAESGILLQINAKFLISLRTKRKAIALLKKGSIHFIGSDCHNVTTRPPCIGRAFEVVRKKLGHIYLDQMHEYGRSLLVGRND